MSNRGRELTHGGDAVGVRQLHLHVPQRLFCPLALGDVPRDASVAAEAPRLIKHRQARNRYVALASVGGGSRELKVTERQVGLEGLPVLAPGLRVRLQVGHFPPCLADFRARRRRVCKRSEEHTSELQSQSNLVCRLLLEKKKKKKNLIYFLKKKTKKKNKNQ